MTQSCSLFQKIETPWGPVRFIMSSIVLPGGSDAVIIGQKTVREKLGIDVMAQLHASVLTAHGRCLLYTSPSPRDATLSRMPSSA